MKSLLLGMIAAVILLPAVSQADDKEFAKLKGSYKMVSARAAGRDAPAEFLKTKLVVDGDKFSLVGTKGGKERKETNTVKVDIKKSPKTIDFLKKDGSVQMRGIYKLEGKKLSLVFTGPKGERPSKFEAEAGSRNFMLVFEKE